MKIFKNNKSKALWSLRLLLLFLFGVGIFIYYFASNMIPFFPAREDVLNGYGNILAKIMGIIAACFGICLLIITFIPDSIIQRKRKNSKKE